jgi:hypothetical protein
MKTVVRHLPVFALVLLLGQNGDSNLQPNQIQFALAPIAASAVLHRQQAAPHLRNANGTSQNWSGYAVESNLNSPSSGAVSDVKGTWTVPQVSSSGSAHTYSSIWVGIDGYSDNTVEQTGTEQDWTPSGPVYYAWFEMYPKFAYRIVNFPLRPGDQISSEVKYVGNSRFTLTIANLTRGVKFSTTQRHKAQRSSAEWIVEAPYSGGILPLADFGTITFTGCSANLSGHAGSISDPAWQYDAIIMADSDGTVKARPSSLSQSGSTFSVNWQSE